MHTVWMPIALAVLTAAGQSTPRPSPADPPPALRRADELLTAYQQARFDDVDSALVGVDSLSTLADALRKVTAAAAGGERNLMRLQTPEVARLRLVSAAVGLEAAQRRGRPEVAVAVALVEWSCTLLRRNRDLLPGEEAWFHASAALLQGLAAGSALELHVDHALARFPDHPRLVLARAVAAELRTYPDARGNRTLEWERPNDYDLLVYRLGQAQKLEAVRDEAGVRLAWTFLRVGRARRALDELGRVSPEQPDAYLAYLAELFRGRALEAEGRHTEAIAAYEAATVIRPGAQTAAVALAAALVREGRAAEAWQVAERLVQAARPDPHDAPFATPDPWLAYGQADLRFWPDLVSRLRAAIQP